MTAYYNEIDPGAAAWLRELIKAGLIAPGDVDERSIEDVTPAELLGYTQCHFFAGIGVWSYALRKAGWPDDRPIWTGSCPCQPFSAAGKGKGFADERHLWPAFHWLIQQCRPDIVFGEQVDTALKSGWWDLVANDLEALDYATAAAVIPASAVGAPHMRHRLFFVAKCGTESYNRVNAPQSREQNGHKNLQQMPLGKTSGSILLGEAISGREALLLQDVRQGQAHQIPDGLVHGAMGGPQGAAQEACPQGEGLLASAQDDLPGEGAGLSGQGAGSEEGCPVRSGPACESLAGTDQCRVLRTHGGSVPAGRAEEFRQPLTGSHSAGTGLHICQREGCLLCDELRAGNMGRSTSALDIGSLEEEKGNLKNASLDDIQAHGKNDNDTWGQADSGDQGIGAPHIRERLYWVADANDAGLEGWRQPGRERAAEWPAGTCSVVVGMADDKLQQRPIPARGDLAARGRQQEPAEAAGLRRNSWPGSTNGHWGDADWLGCRDGKWRPVEPGTQPLVDGTASRVGLLRGYGNAIVAPQAQAFIEAYLEVRAA